MTVYAFSDNNGSLQRSSKRKRIKPPEIDNSKDPEITSPIPYNPHFQQLLQIFLSCKKGLTDDASNSLQAEIESKMSKFVDNLAKLLRDYVEIQLFQKKQCPVPLQEGSVAVCQFKGPLNAKDQLDTWAADFRRFLDRKTSLIMNYWQSNNNGALEIYSIYQNYEEAMESCRLVEKWLTNTSDVPNKFGNLTSFLMLEKYCFVC
eukprot:TRINITY_DN4114_c0_g1_i2.p1 TRINITY_DN4114_c0_g1~~TRINITY_DN4114_c0_g1_i2.p1  ORF type:complete len:239 (-),score=28.05 TRINITY_DN4114_c0_g1_i2:49-660(-)